jgi:ribonuclease J
MSLRLVPLGGLGEIGMNAMVVEAGGRRLLVDCGLLFPRMDKGRGFDVYVPDLSYLRERIGALDAVVLTHGHEDHVGALPILLREFKVPVFGGPFALRQLKGRLLEHQIEADLRVFTAGTRFSAGPFEVEGIHVNHSIPDAMGLAIRGDFGTVVHTGDFKIDPDPFEGKPTDLPAFARAAGATVLLSDSTNAERAGTTASENDVRRTLRTLVQQARGRVVVTMFASHVVRMQQLVEICAEANRKLVVAGRGMIENLRAGQELGHIKGAGAVIVDAEHLDQLREEETVIAMTGAQGEPRSALWRMTFDPEFRMKVRPGDTVVFCARPIPGNELGIQELVNGLWERGATVVTQENFDGDGVIHASGHASRDEQLQMLQTVNPATFIPIHGEARQLARHVRLARERHPAAQVVLARDGDIIDFPEPGGAQIVGKAKVGKIAQVSRGGGVVTPETIALRGTLSEGGAVVVVLVVERATGLLLRSPELTAIGVTDPGGNALNRAREWIRDELAGLSDYARREPEELKNAAMRAVVRSFRRDGERRPVVQPVVVEI